MKTRNLFLSLFAFAALCACNKEAQPEVPQILEEDAYIKVNIMATGASTRAEYVKGEVVENEVKNALFLLYDDSGNPVMYAEPTLEFSALANDGNNIARTATIIIPAKKIKPTKMVVILNHDGASNYTGANLSTLKTTPLTDFVVDIDGVKYYTMTNSVYTDDASNEKTAEDVICEVNLTNDNFGENAAEGGTNSATDPVEVYVERVAAKVILKEKDGGIDVTASEEEVVVIDGTEFKKENLTITPTILGYDVTEDAQKSYLTKKVLPNWDYDGWTNPGNFRSYWAESIATPGYNYKDFEEIENTPAAVYVHENTTANTTKVILAAQLKVDGNAIDLVQYNGAYYNIDSFKLLAKNTIEANTEYVVDVTDFNILTKESGAPSIKSYQMILGVDYGSGSEAKTAAINDILEDMVVMYWKDGQCYYYAEIKHDIPAVAGVVRNHVYELSLNSLEGLGISVPGVGGDIDPETPTDVYYSLNATINILEWRLVKQDVSFN